MEFIPMNKHKKYKSIFLARLIEFGCGFIIYIILNETALLRNLISIKIGNIHPQYLFEFIWSKILPTSFVDEYHTIDFINLMRNSLIEEYTLNEFDLIDSLDIEETMYKKIVHHT